MDDILPGKKSPILHLGIIPDGNRRFAQSKGQVPWWGHEKGTKKMLSFFHWVFEDWEIPVLTIYGLSSKNLERPKIELSRIFALMRWALEESEKKDSFMMKNVRIRFIGRLNLLPKGFQKLIKRAQALTSKNSRFRLNIALAYDGQAEIADAVSKGARTEAEIERALYLGDLPQPDLIIRTSGERRLSGFLLWGSSYSEFFFCEKNWPDFSKSDLRKAVLDYSRRNRRFGK